MATVEFVSGFMPPPGWRFQSKDYGAVHLWLDEQRMVCASVVAGADSWDRARALLADPPHDRAIRVAGRPLYFDAQTWEWFRHPEAGG